MKQKKSTLLLMTLALWLGTLAHAQITSDFDKTADFSAYKTYNFAGWVDNSDQVINELDRNRITSAIKNEFDARDMSFQKEKGDVTITLFIVIDKKTSKTAYTDYVGGMGYAGRWGYGYGYGGMGMGSSTTTIQEDDYMEGTFVIDMYDNETKKLVWQGIIKSVVKEKPEKREKSIPKSVKKLMKKYPVAPAK